MKTRASKQWIAGGALGAVLLGTVAMASSASAADANDPAGEGVDVSVDIADLTPGVLSLTVDGDAVALSENGSDEEIRRFTGTLPTVTVTDTRTADEIPDGAAWYVMGQAVDFVGDDGQEPISAGNLGWTPVLTSGSESGMVEAGEETVPVIEEPTDAGNNVGLEDQELLASTFESAAVNSEGSWTANANLLLSTPADVAPGSYNSTVTLSLFE